MNINGKFIIYYEPVKDDREYMKSFTLSFSRINKEDNTFKKKVILEHRSRARNTIEEYKIKEIHLGAKNLLDKIHKVDFKKSYSKPVKGSEYFCIKYGNRMIETSNIDEIRDILELFNFVKLSDITHKHYKYIKDMDEYTKLLDILNSKITSLNGEEISSLSQIFKTIDPYKIFQSMDRLPEFIKLQNS